MTGNCSGYLSYGTDFWVFRTFPLKQVRYHLLRHLRFQPMQWANKITKVAMVSGEQTVVKEDNRGKRQKVVILDESWYSGCTFPHHHYLCDMMFLIFSVIPTPHLLSVLPSLARKVLRAHTHIFGGAQTHIHTHTHTHTHT